MPSAVIYARFSCSKQREASIADQLRVCRAWCAREGYEVVAEYCDYAISGRSDNRPEFQRMIANAGEAEVCVVFQFDRFSRDAFDAPYYKRRLLEKGTRLVSATEAVPDSPEAVLIEKIYEGLSVVESAHISMRTRRGMEGGALACRAMGVRVFGYDVGEDGRYAVNDAEAAVVREVFARHNDGEPSNAIARDLAARGVRTYTGRPASYTFVHNLLKNEKYTGVYVWGGVRIPEGMPAIVGEDVFRMAQKVQPRKRRAAEDWGAFILSGRAICMGCGRNMVGASGHGRGGVKYEYYRCGARCGEVSPVRADWLEGAIASAIRDLLNDRDRALELADMLAAYISSTDTAAKLEAANKRAQDATRAIDNLTRAVADGMPYELAAPEIDRYATQRAAAEAEAAMIEGAAFDAEEFVTFLQFGATLDDAHLLDAFVYQVLVAEDTVTVVLNYDTKKCEPARIELVRTFDGWLPMGQTMRTIGVLNGAVLLRFPLLKVS